MYFKKSLFCIIVTLKFDKSEASGIIHRVRTVFEISWERWELKFSSKNLMSLEKNMTLITVLESQLLFTYSNFDLESQKSSEKSLIYVFFE